MRALKKLLLLGGSNYLLPVIREAHALGLYVVTCDYLPDNAAHKYADEYRNISILDKDAVLEAARELGVSGVMSFACDPGVTTAASPSPGRSAIPRSPRPSLTRPPTPGR